MPSLMQDLGMAWKESPVLGSGLCRQQLREAWRLEDEAEVAGLLMGTVEKAEHMPLREQVRCILMNG